MSLWDDVASDTLGVAYRAWTGNVDRWTLNQIKEQTAIGIGKASGDSADPGVIAYRQAQADAEIDNALISIDAHPSQSTGLPRIPGLGVIGSVEFLAKAKKIVNWTLFVGAVGAVAYFGFVYSRSFKRVFRRK